MRKILFLTLTVLFPILLTVLFVKGIASMGSSSVGWQQSNESGFGTPDNAFVSGLETFQGHLYAGTWNDQDSAEVWRTADGTTWELFALPEVFTDTDIYDSHVFDGRLYVARGRYNAGPGGEIWRTDGLTWEKVVTGGFCNPSNGNIISFAIYSETLYVATQNFLEGAEVWKSSTGNLGNWTLVHNFGVGVTGNGGFITMEEFGNQLYIGFHRNFLGELWRTDGLAFTPVFTDGLGNPSNTVIPSLAEFNGQLYLETRNLDQGGELWRSEEGLTWTNVFTSGLGNPDNGRLYGLFVHQNHLYAVFSNGITGSEVWRSPDGETWTQIAGNGWGDSANDYADYADHGAAVFQDQIYISTRNLIDGGEVWVWSLYQAFLPAIFKNTE